MTPLYLVVRDGIEPDRVVGVTARATVGRDLASDVVVGDAEVSRHHATFVPTRDGWVVDDEGSTNGTYVNGARLVGASPVGLGDVIQVGRVTLEIVDGP